MDTRPAVWKPIPKRLKPWAGSLSNLMVHLDRVEVRLNEWGKPNLEVVSYSIDEIYTTDSTNHEYPGHGGIYTRAKVTFTLEDLQGPNRFLTWTYRAWRYRGNLWKGGDRQLSFSAKRFFLKHGIDIDPEHDSHGRYIPVSERAIA